MALNIKNPEVEALIEEVSRLTGESKTEAVRRALQERKTRLMFRLAGNSRALRLQSFLEREIWSSVPAEKLGTTMSKKEEEAILGYGEAGT